MRTIIARWGKIPAPLQSRLSTRAPTLDADLRPECRKSGGRTVYQRCAYIVTFNHLFECYADLVHRCSSACDREARRERQITGKAGTNASAAPSPVRTERSPCGPMDVRAAEALPQLVLGHTTAGAIVWPCPWPRCGDCSRRDNARTARVPT